MLPVTTETTRELQVTAGFQLTLQRPLAAGTYTLGIRPNQLLALPVAAGAGNGVVTNVETLGELTIIEVLTDNGTALRIVQSGQVQFPLEQRVQVSDQGKILIFDEHEQLIAEEEGATNDQFVSVN